MDGILFADPKRSVVNIVQASGRALRLSPDKDMGYIIVPVVTGSEDDPDSLVDDSSFENVIRVLRALASNDERIVEYFRDISMGAQTVSGPVDIVFPAVLPTRISLQRFVSAVTTKCWQSVAKLSWRPFEQAREFVRSLGLQRTKDWKRYCSGHIPDLPALPPDIPRDPYSAYQNSGWSKMRDWLGFAWLPYEEAKEFVHSLHLKGWDEWKDYCAGKRTNLPPLPLDIPKTPTKTYEDDGWVGVKDWLGTTRMNYGKAKRFAQGLGLKNMEQWYDYVRGKRPELPSLPGGIPKLPDKVYKEKGWKGWGDWLRGGKPEVRRSKSSSAISAKRRRKSDYLSYPEARDYARGLGLKSSTERQRFGRDEMPEIGRLPDNVPTQPHRTYRNDGWAGYGDWLGYETNTRERQAKREFRSARTFARLLGLRSWTEWTKYAKGELSGLPPLPIDIPMHPYHAYRDSGWKGMADWLGYDRTCGKWQSFEAACGFARTLGLRSFAQWGDYCKNGHPDLPAKPKDIPVLPHAVYKSSGWSSWMDWLGYAGRRGRGQRAYREFRDAREFARSLHLKSYKDWAAYCQGKKPEFPTLPPDVPVEASRVYKNRDWISWQNWFGTEFRRFSRAREFACGLGLILSGVH